MVDTKSIKPVIDRMKEKDHIYVDIDAEFIDPVMSALGDDVDDIISYLDGLDNESLDAISGCFEHIYDKFMSDNVWDALERLAKKIGSSQ